MTVFVVIGGWSYEGYDTPHAVASTLDKAKEMAKTAYDRYDEMKILEYELDEFEFWPACATPKEHKC